MGAASSVTTPHPSELCAARESQSLGLCISSVDGLRYVHGKVRARIRVRSAKVGKRVVAAAETLSRGQDSSANVNWRAYRTLGDVENSDEIIIDIFQKNIMGDSVLCSAQLHGSHLLDMVADDLNEQRVYLGEQGIHYAPEISLSGVPQYPVPRASILLRRVHFAQSSRKRIFFIRHAESEWNVMQRNADIVGMISKRDHPLTLHGISQAITLLSRWESAMRKAPVDAPIDAPSESEDTGFMHADAIFVSPHARSVQTALLALQGHPCLKSRGIKIAAFLREVKRIGGIDCLGNPRDVVMETTSRHLNQTLGSTRAAALFDSLPCVDMYDTDPKWWSSTFDHSKSTNARLDELMYTVRYSSMRNAIVVGHSQYLKKFCARFIRGHFCVSGARGVYDGRRLAIDKIENAACVQLDVICAPHGAWIGGAQLLYGSDFVDRTRSKQTFD